MCRKMVVMVVLLVCSVASALGPIGSPTATLKEGQVELGYDWVTSEQDIQLTGVEPTAVTLEGIDVDAHIFTLGYGVTDGVDIWARLGLVDIDNDLDFDEDNLIGIGTRITLLGNPGDELTLGTSIQANWLKVDIDIPSDYPKEVPDIEAQVSLTEMIVAIGPTWDLGNIAVYGGSALYYLDGDVSSYGMQIQETEDLIWFVGGLITLTPGWDIRGEYQFADDFEVLSIGTCLRF